MNKQGGFYRRLLLAILTLTTLGVVGCSSDDPYLKAKAEREQALVRIDAAKAQTMEVDSQIKRDKWELEKQQEQAKADVAVVSLQSQASRQKAQADAEISRLQISADVQRTYATQEKEAELRRQWVVFWIGVGFACLVVGTGLAISVDRYRIARRQVIVGLQTEVARYTEILKQELEKICKAQRQSNQLRGNIKAAEEQHLQIRTNIQSAEATLQLVLAQVAEAEEKLNRVNEQLTAPKERQTTIPFPTVRASVRKDLSGNGNGNAPEAESA